MTQDDYKLWTGETVSYESTDWERIVAVAKERLASFLCLEQYPDDASDSLNMVLANFICAVLKHQGNGAEAVASKSVRNFTISFTNDTAKDVYAQIYRNYADVLDRYSMCELTFNVEKSAPDERF